MGVPRGKWFDDAVRNGLIPSNAKTVASVGRWAVEFWVEWRPVNESNQSGGLKAKLGRKAEAKEATAAALPPSLPAPPVLVTLTRIGGQKPMDRDGLATSLKWVQDAVAKALGVDDGDRAKVRFRYKQRPAWGRTRVLVRVETA